MEFGLFDPIWVLGADSVIHFSDTVTDPRADPESTVHLQFTQLSGFLVSLNTYFSTQFLLCYFKYSVWKPYRGVVN